MLKSLKAKARIKHAYLKVIGLQRSDYRATWDTLSGFRELAMASVASTDDPQEFFASGEVTCATIVDALAINSRHSVLEIGCGIGRIGKFLAPKCARWIGCDISDKMIQEARSVLQNCPNADLITLNDSNLSGIEDSHVDKVYCSAVFMHLDEWDRYEYVREAYRVLKDEGQCYFDNVNLCGDKGWGIFMEMTKHARDCRPANISKTSTPEELATFLTRAGFEDIELRPGSHFVAAIGTKRTN